MFIATEIRSCGLFSSGYDAMITKPADLAGSLKWILNFLLITRIPYLYSIFTFQHLMSVRALSLILFFSASITSGYAQAVDFWNISFAKADSIAFRYQGHDLKHPDELTDSLVAGLTSDVEKFRTIFRWITDNISYDYRLYLQSIKKEKRLRERGKKPTAYLVRLSRKKFKRTIRRKIAVCSGYSMLLEYMCERAGIPCETVIGYARNFSTSIDRQPNHAWNAVKLSNKWYLCDVTWASGTVDPDVGRFFKKFNVNYFLTDPHLFISNHFPENIQWALVRNAPSLKDFMEAPLKPDGFVRNMINNYSPEKKLVKSKLNEKTKFAFTSNASFISPDALLVIKKIKKKSITVPVELHQSESGEYEIEYAFSEKGDYLVYIEINGHDTFVYRVIVQ